MSFVGAYWWLWLVIFLVSGGYAMFNQLKRMKGMMNKGLSGDVKGAAGSFFSGVKSMIVAGLISSGAGILLAIAVLVNIFAH